jgi:hypothetical protein
MAKRGKAYRRWKSQAKYVSRIKKNLYYWTIKDESCPNGYRMAKNWKELDAENGSIKRYKKTAKKWSYVYEKVEAHLRVKRLRNEAKDIINNTLKEQQQHGNMQ